MGWNSKKRESPESIIENYLKEQVEKNGGFCPKWESPKCAGVPDRIIFMPNQLHCYVECKREIGGKVSRIQIFRAQELENYGHRVFFVNTKEQIRTLIKYLKKGELPQKGVLPEVENFIK